MSSVEIDIEATDNASPAINSASNSLANLSTQAGATGSASMGMSNTMVGGFARMGITALASFDMIQAAGDRLASTQMQQQIAQERLTTAVQQYGAGSTQAVEAQQQLQIATDNVSRAQEQYYMRLAMAAATIIPQMITQIPKLIANLNGYSTAAEYAAAETTTLSMSMMTLLGLGVGVVALLGMFAAGGVFSQGGSSNNNVNVYGDINMPAGATLGTIGTNAASLYRG